VISLYDNEDLYGFAQAVLMTKDPTNPPEIYRETLFVKIIVVRKDLDKATIKDLFTKIIYEIENFAAKKDLRRIRIGGYPIWYIFPGIEINYYLYISILEDLNYKKLSEYVNYEIDLAEFYLPERVKILEKKMIYENIFIRNIRWEELDLVSEWIRNHFGVIWSREIRLASLRNKPSIIIAEDITNKEILAFSAYSTLVKNRFGPIGVVEKYRRLGIGTVLLYKSLQEMKNIGVRIAEIPWTSHLFFYSHLPGVRRLRHFIILEKVLR